MTHHHPLRTTVLVGAIGPKIPPWAGPTRLSGSLATQARSRLSSQVRAGSLGVGKWPDTMGD